MTLGTNSSLGALRTEAVTGWELCQPENFPESSKLAHSKSKSLITSPPPPQSTGSCQVFASQPPPAIFHGELWS